MIPNGGVPCVVAGSDGQPGTQVINLPASVLRKFTTDGVATTTPGVQPDGSMRLMGRRSMSTSALPPPGDDMGQVTVRIQVPKTSPRGVDRIQAVQNLSLIHI